MGYRRLTGAAGLTDAQTMESYGLPGDTAVSSGALTELVSGATAIDTDTSGQADFIVDNDAILVARTFVTSPAGIRTFAMEAEVSLVSGTANYRASGGLCVHAAADTLTDLKLSRSADADAPTYTDKYVWGGALQHTTAAGQDYVFARIEAAALASNDGSAENRGRIFATIHILEEDSTPYASEVFYGINSTAATAAGQSRSEDRTVSIAVADYQRVTAWLRVESITSSNPITIRLHRFWCWASGQAPT